MRLNILVFAAGVLAVQFLPDLPSRAFWLGGVAAAALLTGAALFPGGRRRRVLFALAALLAGVAWSLMRADLRLAEELPPDWEGRDMIVVGVVAEMPQSFARGERFVFAVEKVLTEGASLPGRIMLSWYQPGHDAPMPMRGMVAPGERWQMTIRLKRPHGNANPHGFDYEAWLLERGIRATGHVRPQSPPQRIAAFVPEPGYIIEWLRYQVRDRFLAALPESDHPYTGILVALAVGDQRAIQGEFWRVFARTGTTHLMSISGLHVTMVAALVAGLVGTLWRRVPRLMVALPAQRAAVLAGWMAALAYALLSGFSVPAQRTAYMLSVAAIALLSGRRTVPSRVLAAALLLVLLIDPWAVLAPGFWLSFGAVSLLFYVAVGRESGERAGSAGSRLRMTLAAWGTTQWAVTIGSLPLLLLFFQQFSLISPLANAIAIPIISFIITPLALLAIVLPSGWMSWLLQLDHALLSLLMEMLIRMAELPVFERPAPPHVAVWLAMLGVVWLLMPRGVPARGLGIVLLLPALLFQPVRPDNGKARVTVLDVGQGLAVVVQTASKTLLYDSGPLYSAESDAGQRIVVPYLRAIGVSALEAMVITHSDTDHSGGAASVMTAMPVGRLLSSIPELPGDACTDGQAWEWEGVRFRMLHPQAQVAEGRRVKPNHQSCVLRIEAAGKVMLLTSDIEATDERTMLANDAAAVRADILLVPHHGSRTSSTPEFVAAVGARDVVYPVGYRNRFGHPRADVVARYGDARIWRTDQHGAITFELGGDVPPVAWREAHPRYWHGR